MDSPSQIRLLATDNNVRGDLFTRLIEDLFFALGYEDLKRDVAQSGREIDLQGRHRFENRRVIGECKAHKARIGGDDINKFRGVLGIERDRPGPPVSGYFVSLSGFKESARAQEATASASQVLLLDAAQVIAELQRSRLLVELTAAAERAGQCARHARLNGAELQAAELLGDTIQGYVWALRYAQGKQPTHFALVHADGTPLAEPVARILIEADRECGGDLHTLRYLAPPPPAPDRAALGEAAGRRYRAWLE
ncbi:restriction endonuclease [uncultured Thiodictyon sp.]|uniref:restriction endonuclease n=1 Tax=uncultured Thiodictyon sp. TaxID=1846217 RepID=UPI0025D0203C|nr:restriction endonuclease [uncultured Thiodictyon sp.]